MELGDKHNVPALWLINPEWHDVGQPQLQTHNPVRNKSWRRTVLQTREMLHINIWKRCKMYHTAALNTQFWFVNCGKTVAMDTALISAASVGVHVRTTTLFPEHYPVIHVSYEHHVTLVKRTMPCDCDERCEMIGSV